MTYSCYIEFRSLFVPYMGSLSAETPMAAVIEARDLLRREQQGISAHVYERDTCVASVRREEIRH